MLDNLTTRLAKVVKTLRGQARLTEDNIQDALREVRMALLEARRAGVHPFCITIDRQAHEYMAHMYGPARYVILDDVGQLPGKVADIYRRLTH